MIELQSRLQIRKIRYMLQNKTRIHSVVRELCINNALNVESYAYIIFNNSKKTNKIQKLISKIKEISTIFITLGKPI